MVGEIFKKFGFIGGDLDKLKGRVIGLAVAERILAFSKSIGINTKITELFGFRDEHIKWSLTAVQNPQLEMKLKKYLFL